MTILLIGLNYPTIKEKELIKLSNGNISVAHHKFIENLYTGLTDICSKKIYGVYSYPVGTYPKKCKKIVFADDFSEDIQIIGFINLPIIKHIIRKYKMNRIIKEWERDSKEEKFIIVYDTYIPFLKAALKNKRNYKVIDIIADLPGKYSIEDNAYNYLKSLYLKYRELQYYRIVNRCDGYVLLTKYMADILNNRKPYIVMEGITEPISFDTKTETEKKVMLYAGELSSKVGIEILVKAFILLNDEKVELAICGKGDMEEYLIEQSKSNNRIKYYGYVSSSEMRIIETNTDIYINPRQDKYEFTKYSFPSKNLEYLRTGKPVIAYMLKGIPEEYREYLFIPEDDSVTALTNTMKKTLALNGEELKKIAVKQKKFINSKKTSRPQCMKIVKLLELIK